MDANFVSLEFCSAQSFFHMFMLVCSTILSYDFVLFIKLRFCRNFLLMLQPFFPKKDISSENKLTH